MRHALSFKDQAFLDRDGPLEKGSAVLSYVMGGNDENRPPAGIKILVSYLPSISSLEKLSRS